MDAGTSQAYLTIKLLLSINAILLMIVGFFIRGLIAKFTISLKEVTLAMAHVDKTLAVVETNVGNYNKNIEYLYTVEVRLDREIKGLRERIHEVVTHVSRLEATIITSSNNGMLNK